MTMNANRGIFDALPPSDQNGVNPFSFAGEAPAANNPFAAAPAQSPFASVEDYSHDRQVPEPGKPAKIPAPRLKVAESPFQMAAENGSAYGYEAPQISNLAAAPFTAAPQAYAQPAAATVAPVQQNPFTVHRDPAPQSTTAMPQQSFGAWPQTQDVAAAASFAQHLHHAAPSPAPVMAHAPAYSAPAPIVHEEAPVVRQLELRAIFGVDREMSAEEILQRTRSLPGVKHIARIGAADVLALENLKQTLATLGFGGGAIRLYSGSVPVEFVRDGRTMLAVQTDGGFAPGVREAIMIVARELEKMG